MNVKRLPLHALAPTSIEKSHTTNSVESEFQINKLTALVIVKETVKNIGELLFFRSEVKLKDNTWISTTNISGANKNRLDSITTCEM